METRGAGVTPSHSHPRLMTLPKVLIAMPSRSEGRAVRRSRNPVTDGRRWRPSLIEIKARSDGDPSVPVSVRPSTSKVTPWP